MFDVIQRGFDLETAIGKISQIYISFRNHPLKFPTFLFNYIEKDRAWLCGLVDDASVREWYKKVWFCQMS